MTQSPKTKAPEPRGLFVARCHCGKATKVLFSKDGRRKRQCTSGHETWTQEFVIDAAPHGGARPGAGRRAAQASISGDTVLRATSPNSE